jgi:hypothetical protein
MNEHYNTYIAYLVIDFSIEYTNGLTGKTIPANPLVYLL